MPNETRINLKHLLQDIRDGYTSPIEEVIITELVANALDSGADRVDFLLNPPQLTLTCVDNGRGMTRSQFKEYHNIASSHKIKGQGIGFAGVGAKLSLLISDYVISQTKGPRRGRCASQWYLSNDYKAPWKNIPSNETITWPRGTAVEIKLSNAYNNLLNNDFVKQTIIKHFYPLLNQELTEKVYFKLYNKKKIKFYIDNQPLVLPEDTDRHNSQWFEVKLNKQRRPIGCGFLALKNAEVNWLDKITRGKPTPLSLNSGLTISTYGKVIKSGWEWIGLSPKKSFQLVGLVEIPAMAELLTTNKDNFLSDTASLKKYYRLRKAIQETMIPLLKIFGEDQPETERQASRKFIKPLSKQIENTLSGLAKDYPELSTIIGQRSTQVNAKKANKADIKNTSGQKVLNATDGIDTNTKTNPNQPITERVNKQKDKQGKLKKTIKRPGIKIILKEFAPNQEKDKIELGRIIDDTVYINISHPSWKYSLNNHSEEYHIAICTSLLLYDFIAVGENPQNFVSKFLQELSEHKKPKTLF